MRSNSTAPFISKLKELNWPDDQICVNLFFMYFAASETTASAMNYILWQLGKSENRQYIEKIKNPESSENFLSKLVAETLRLHPPTFIIGRQFRRNTLLEVTDSTNQKIKIMKLRRGCSIVCLIQTASLNPARYKNPTQFNPDRFDTVPALLPWYPFGTGHHVCPGQHLAQAEIKVFISRIINKFSLETISPAGQTQQKGFFSLRATAAQLKLK